MATFGYETIGSSNVFIADNFNQVAAVRSDLWTSRYSPSSDGTLDSITIYLGGDNAVDVKAVIYEEDGNAANSHTLVEVIENTSVSATPGWRTFTSATNPSLSSAKDYLIGAVADATDLSSGNSFYIYYDTFASSAHCRTNGFSYSSPDDPWSQTPFEGPSQLGVSAYATYTPSGGSSRRIIIT